MIFNDQFYQEFDKVQGGKQIFLSLAVSYFQERLTNDKNPLLKHYSPEMYGKLAFYAVEKPTISISQNKFKYGK